MAANATPAPAPPRGRLVEYLDRSQPEVQHLLEHGWCIVRVFSEEDAARFRDMVWEDLASLGTGIRYKDASTLTKASWPGAPRGLIQSAGVGLWPSHAAAANAAEPTMKRFFGGEDLGRAWDGLGFMKPDQAKRYCKGGDDKEVPGISNWLHTDDAPPRTRNGLLHWTQMVIALEPVEHGDIGTQIIGAPPGMGAQEFCDRFHARFPDQGPDPKKLSNKGKGNACQRNGQVDHTREEKEWLKEHGVPVKPNLRPGEAVVWCSRMPHANFAEDAGDKERNWRTAVLTNYIPVKCFYPKELAKRREMAENPKTSGHQVVCPGALFGKNGALAQQTFGIAPNMYGGPPKDGFDYKSEALPIMRGFKRHARPYEKWTAEERADKYSPDVDPELYKVHRDTARLCFGYRPRKVVKIADRLAAMEQERERREAERKQTEKLE